MLTDGVLEDNDLEEDIQIAPFHPLFEFEGSEGKIDNLTNRSPYPIFHILRNEEVTVAVDALDGDSRKVWKRNVQLFEDLEEELGREETTNVVIGDDEPDAATREKVKEVLRKIKKKFRLPGL